MKKKLQKKIVEEAEEWRRKSESVNQNRTDITMVKRKEKQRSTNIQIKLKIE